MTCSNHTSPAVPALDDIARDQHRDITATVQAECQHLQALEDAIAYRRARVATPCPNCTAIGHRCDDHACDLDLIAGYQQTAMAAVLDASSQTDAIRRNHHTASPRDETPHAQPSDP